MVSVMPTNDERREVAENLRNMCGCGCRYAEEFYELLNETVMRAWDFHDFRDVANRLADLIEPEERTCRMCDTSWDDGRCTWGCICSECGAKHEHERGAWMNFCPNCGAKVVQQ